MAIQNRILRICIDEQIQGRNDVQEIGTALHAEVRDRRGGRFGRDADEELSEVEKKGTDFTDLVKKIREIRA